MDINTDTFIKEFNNLNLENSANSSQTSDDELFDELIESFTTSVNTYNGEDEYKLLVCGANMNYFDYNKECENKTVYRYKRYLSCLKLNEKLVDMITMYIEYPEFQLMKAIDNYILNIVDSYD
jgi:hypothetical protein